MEADVIVVGAGPSGLTVASELARQGSTVIVLERRNEPVQSRAGTILPRVLELLDYRGLAQHFIGRATEIRSNPFITAHIWAGMQPIFWRNLGTEFPYRLILPQNITEEVLSEVATDQGVTIMFGHTLDQLEQSDDGVLVGTAREDGTRTQFRARYVVGADGSRSSVRALSGIDFPGHDGTFTGIIADIPINMNWPGGRGMRDNKYGWATSFPFGADGKSTRFNMVHADRRYADRSEPVTVEEVRMGLEQIFERPIEFDQLTWASRFTDAMRIATKFRSGRVFLVGESARIHYPSSGVGMNFCIQDGFNLGWKLGRVVAGTSPEEILDTYEAERRPVAEALLESVRAQCAIQFDFTDEGISFRRMFSRNLLPLPQVNREIALQLNGLTEPYATSIGSHAAVGRPVPPLTVQTVDGLYRLPELLSGAEFVLLDLSGDGSFSSATYPGVRIVNAVLPTPPEDWGELKGVLIRPDGYVDWVIDNIGSDTVPLDRWAVA
ncbi:FAD-dependent oxidoreductase [Glaciihabitans sp. UYNi722]|uniref:FAD-dependent oxidoreductase n=1 Tax=Glaciihabitans sp. UYNi722 TaxID=3156344 RepID=UPI003394B84A